VTVRPAHEGDVPALAALEESLFGADAWSAASVGADVEAGRVLVAQDAGGPVVGFVVTLPAGDAVDLLRIGVHPEHRRRGTAHALLEAAGDERRMLLEVSDHNEAALAFYAAEGFTEVARRSRYYKDGTDAVVMERLGGWRHA